MYLPPLKTELLLSPLLIVAATILRYLHRGTEKVPWRSFPVYARRRGLLRMGRVDEYPEANVYISDTLKLLIATCEHELFETWVYGIAGRQREDLVIVDEEDNLSNVRCDKQSHGKLKNGWDCIWAHIPHLCHRPKLKDWSAFMRGEGASELDVESATGLTFKDVHAATVRHSEEWFESFDSEEFDAHQVLLRLLLWNHLQPWLGADMREVVKQAPPQVRRAPFLGICIPARGDGAVAGGGDGGSHADIETYLSRAKTYMESGSSSLAVDDIHGIWIVTDEKSVVGEVQALARTYFPQASAVISLSSREGDVISAGTTPLTYKRVVWALVDLLQLSRSVLYVGPSTNDVTRVVALLRAHLGKSKASMLSIGY